MLKDKVAIITGAGRGIGYGEAILFAKLGAKVVVNDLGCDWRGSGSERMVADKVVDEIRNTGGEAIPSYENVADFNSAKKIIDTAVENFGRLDILVNNAGILRDRMIFNMTEEEFDAVVNVNFKGTFNCCRHACAYFREAYKAGKISGGRIINTTSIVGLLGNIGQVNYAGAKAAVANMTVNIAMEMRKYGVTCNAISPGARTRLTVSSFGPDWGKPKEGKFDEYNPANIAPLVAFLASDDAKDITGKIFHIVGGKIELFQGWTSAKQIVKDGRWEPEELSREISKLLS